MWHDLVRALQGNVCDLGVKVFAPAELVILSSSLLLSTLGKKYQGPDDRAHATAPHCNLISLFICYYWARQLVYTHEALQIDTFV